MTLQMDVRMDVRCHNIPAFSLKSMGIKYQLFSVEKVPYLELCY